MRALLFVIAITSACASDPVADACKRADDCNALTGSIQECTENFDSALNQLPQSQQEEYRHAIDDCLTHPSCSAFVSCINALVN